MSDLSGEQLFKELLESAPDAMIIVSQEGEIVRVNSQTEKLFGYSRQELIGQTLEVLIPQRYRGNHISQRNGYFGSPSVRPMGASLDLFASRKDGSEFPVEISLSPLKTDSGNFAISAIRDISDRKKIEERVLASLREKEVLLKEVHHRVKNNLQIISSIINLQAQSLDDARTKELLNETRSRIRSMALVHERLYESKNLSGIDFKAYVEGLMHDLFEGYGVGKDRIKLELKIESVQLDIEQTINCGLIVNELVSNAIKHAFPENKTGTIKIELKRTGNKVMLCVEDNGVGFNKKQSANGKETLGLTLVEGLTKELSGSLEIKSEAGAKFVITLPCKET